jgi:hypothetical protein
MSNVRTYLPLAAGLFGITRADQIRRLASRDRCRATELAECEATATPPEPPSPEPGAGDPLENAPC